MTAYRTTPPGMPDVDAIKRREGIGSGFAYPTPMWKRLERASPPPPPSLAPVVWVVIVAAIVTWAAVSWV